MVNGVNWNPFTNKVLTEEQIKHIDENYGNKDGVAQANEIESAYSWLSQQTDTEGGWNFDETNNDVNNASLLTNIQGSANLQGIKLDNVTKDNIDEAFGIVVEEYSALYLAAHKSDFTPEMRQLVLDEIKTQGTEFLKQLKGDTKVEKFDMNKVAADFSNHMNEVFQKKDFIASKNTERIGEYTDSVDTNWESLLSAANQISDDGVVTGSEWIQVRDNAVNYIMGMLLQGESASQEQKDNFAKLQNTIGAKGEIAKYLDDAKALCDKIKTCNDPNKVREYIDKATQLVLKYLNSVGKENVVNGITGAENDLKKVQYENKLQKQVETKVAAYAREKQNGEFIHSQEDISAYRNYLNDLVKNFVSTYQGDEANLISDFNTYVSKLEYDIATVKNAVTKGVEYDPFIEDTVIQELNYIDFGQFPKDYLDTVLDGALSVANLPNDLLSQIKEEIKTNGYN